MRHWTILIALALFGCVKHEPGGLPAAPPTLSGSGTDIGSAGDNFPDEYLAAWFLGEESSIRACAEVDVDFGVTEKKAVGAARKAFLAWGHYLRSHHINESRSPSLRLATQVEWLAKCDETADLRFYLGAEPAAVIEAKKGHFHPTAFAYRTSYDRDKGWGRGFVWVAKQGSIRSGFPDWTLEGRLATMLMHELGHVYGNDHVPGTIMAAEISDLLQSDRSALELGSVDRCRELAPCYACKYETNDDLTKLPKEAWEFFGKPLGLAELRYWGVTLFRDLEGRFTSLQLDLDEKGGTRVFSLDAQSTRAVSDSGPKVFKVVHGSEVGALPDQTTFQYATVVTPGVPAERIGVVAVEVNLATCSAKQSDGRSAVHLSYIYGQQQRPLAAFPLVFGWSLGNELGLEPFP